MAYTTKQLQEAERQIGSTLHKLHETLKTLCNKDDASRYRSQITLVRRRIEAFTIAGELIERELENEPESRMR